MGVFPRNVLNVKVKGGLESGHCGRKMKELDAKDGDDICDG